MKPQYAVALALAAGFGLGVTAIQGLHAQAKPPAYVVIDINEISDASGFKAVIDRGPGNDAAVKDTGGRFLARTQNVTALDGTAPKRFIIIAFDSVEKAKAWNDTAYIKETNAIRIKTTKSRSFIVEGM
jgi:uncharacterized protein (DUF1330 family)